MLIFMEITKMTAIEMLMKDHREAIGLIEELENSDVEQLETADEETTAVQSKEDDFRRLKNALTTHTRLEEQIFYPALANFDETGGLVQTAYEEHETVDELLADLSGLSPTAEEWIELIAVLKENLEHHIEQEEELFPRAEELLGQGRLRELGRQMEELKSGGTASSSARM
jgi:iron-sulfur cluster repair protein YtfE (RIC family)